MGTTKSRKSRRNNSRPTAFSFLSNIALGNENEKPLDELSLTNYQQEPLHFIPEQPQQHHTAGASSFHSTDSSFSAEEDNAQTALHSDPFRASNSNTSPPVITERGNPKRIPSESSNEDVEHHKLTREDSERPIASEKIKKRSTHTEKGHGSLSLLSVFRYYTDKLRPSNHRSASSESSVSRGYVQQQLENHDHHKHRKALSYACFLHPTDALTDKLDDDQESISSYDPFFLDDGKYGLDHSQMKKPAEVRRELNEQFRLNHPEIPPEITLSKIRAIKENLLEIGKELDLEVSSVAHAFVYFEKLIIKNMVTKKNRKLIAACCLFLATKVNNEAKGTWFRPLLDLLDDKLGVDAEEIHEHEFAVFADLEFDLYVPRREFMPHFERILSHLEFKSIQEYLGNSDFYN